MRQLIGRTFAAALLVSTFMAVPGCNQHHRRHNEGPVQAAGRHVDHAADKTGDAIENTGRKINRALPGD